METKQIENMLGNLTMRNQYESVKRVIVLSHSQCMFLLCTHHHNHSCKIHWYCYRTQTHCNVHNAGNSLVHMCCFCILKVTKAKQRENIQCRVNRFVISHCLSQNATEKNGWGHCSEFCFVFSWKKNTTYCLLINETIYS